jgi:hypothetical protein
MAYTDKCLGPFGVGVLGSDEKLTQAARDSFTSQVITLLTSGNADGKGAKISSLLGIPFPPPANIKLFDPDRLLTNPADPMGDLFWFDPSPFAPLTFDSLRDPESGYQKIIITNLYESLMKVMNLNGNAAVPPILDYTGFLPPNISIKLTLPDLPKIAVALPNGIPALEALNLELGDIPSFVANIATIVPTPSIPSLPSIPIPEFDFIIFPKLFEMLLTLPITLLPKLIAKLSVDPLKLLTPSPPELFNLVLQLIFGLILDLLKEIGLLTILPKLLVATFIVMIQNAVIALLCMAISQVIGTGLVVKTVGQALGLA